MAVITLNDPGFTPEETVFHFFSPWSNFQVQPLKTELKSLTFRRDGSAPGVPVPLSVWPLTPSVSPIDFPSWKPNAACRPADQCPCANEGKWKQEIEVWLQALKAIVIFFSSTPEWELAGICQAASSHTLGKYLGSDSPLNHSVIFSALFRGIALSLG